MTCQCGRLIFPGESYGGSEADGYTCSNCILTVQVGLEQKAISMAEVKNENKS